MGVTGSPLDSPDTYARLDPAGLYGRIAALPSQVEEAWRVAWALDVPPDYRAAERIVVLGMGGSGIGGALLSALALDLGAPTSVELVRGYTLPAYVDDRALVLASSNSGNTEEVVATLAQAIDADGARTPAARAGVCLGRRAAVRARLELRVVARDLRTARARPGRVRGHRARARAPALARRADRS
jgi:glucose/mannose-6-phosphate isomerase